MEKPSFEQIRRVYGKRIRRKLRRLGVPARDLDDVAQEVLRAVERRLPAFDPLLCSHPESALSAWLSEICRRRAANHHRGMRRRAEVFFDKNELDAFGSSDRGVEEQYSAHEGTALLRRLLSQLEPDRRAILEAHELEGIAMVDIAVALQIPLNTAWNRLRLAREDLRAAWKKWSREERPNV